MRSARDTSFAAPPSADEGRKKPRVSGGKVDLDEVDDVGEAQHWENVAWDGESDDELEEDSDEVLDGESHEESEQVVRDAIARLQAGETSLL
jgi:hypothetical protein